MSATFTTRFAPSPTGRLHLGNARTALFSWLAARAGGGRFLLRIEDTDLARAVEGSEQGVLEDLRWLGLAWDGTPVHQSANARRHAELLERLEREGRAYPCFCTDAELDVARRTALAARRAPRYAGTCAALAPAEVARRRAAGQPAALRFRVPDGWPVRFDDLVHGPHEDATDSLGDFVIRRADGVPTFLFANAVDDADMGVTLVLRGDDHLSNTPRQLLVLAALGSQEPPRYGHLPLVLAAGSDKPLSKRDGANSLAELRAQGWLPAAVANFLARLGHHGFPDRLLALDELAAAFDVTHLGRAPAHLDPVQLERWQRLAVAALDDTGFAAWAGLDAVPVAARAAFVAAVRGNVLLPAEVAHWTAVCFGAEVAPDDAARAALAEADSSFFAAAHGASAAASGDYGAFARALAAATGRKGRALHAPVRAALTGRVDGPELAALFPLMGEARVAARFAARTR